MGWAGTSPARWRPGWRSTPQPPSDLSPADRVAAANRAIREQVARQPDLEGMATTLTLVELAADGVAHFGHIGDSRAYLYRGGSSASSPTTTPWSPQYVAAGTLSPEEAADHPHSHMLTRCLGLTRFVNVDEIEVCRSSPGIGSCSAPMGSP